MQRFLVPEYGGQHFLDGQRPEPRLDLEHALLELRGFGSGELVAELAEDPDEDLGRAGGVDVGQVEHGSFPGHAEDLILDAERALEVGEVVGEEQVALPSRDAHDDGAHGVGFRQLGDPRNHLRELAGVVVRLSGHLGLQHNNLRIDAEGDGLKSRSQGLPSGLAPRERVSVRRDPACNEEIRAPPCPLS